MIKIILFLFISLSVHNILAQNGICTQQLPPTKKVIKQCCHKPDFLISPYPTIQKKCVFELSAETSASDEIESEHFKNPCTIECILKESGILNNGEINDANVKVALEKSVKDLEYRPIFQTAFASCAKKVKQQQSAANSTVALCSNYASNVLGCVFSEAFINCPPSKRKLNNDICTSARDYLKACDNSYYITQG